MSELLDPVRRYSACVTNRYPELFQELSEKISPKAILSFGCGMGQELLTLRGYFPEASITGVDINPEALASCAELLKEQENMAVMPTADLLNAPADQKKQYDCIFAMNVFKKQSASDCHRQEYPVTKFVTQITQLLSFLRKQGYLVIDGIQYQLHVSDEIMDQLTAVPLVSDATGHPVFCDTDHKYFSKHFLYRKN